MPTPNPQLHPLLGLVGPGRVGSVLTAALAAQGVPIAGWTAAANPSPATLERIRALLPQVPRRSLPELAGAAGILLLAVPDSAVAGVVDELAALDLAGTVAWHVSGRYGVGVLDPLTARGAVPLALHPAMSFTGTSSDLARLSGVRWGRTGGPAAAAAAAALLDLLAGVAVPIAEPDRVAYHAALSHASNFFTLLEGQATDVLRGIGVDDPAALIGPLAWGALAEALSDHPAFTGPVSRGDAGTVSAHLAQLRARDPVIAVTYAALTAQSAQRAGSVGAIDDAAVATLRRAADESGAGTTRKGLGMQVATMRSTLARHLADTPPDAPPGGRALVPTMGALHAGHLALVREARSRVGEAGQVVVSIFVNPLQFGPGEDLDRYPRSLEADLDALRAAGVDLVFTPDQPEIYPRPATVLVDPGPLGSELEGAARPGHFAGVLTVVAKLFALTRPDLAVFGEKDYQQLVLVRRMSEDLDLGVSVVGLPTVREPDGLARSSRNAYLHGPDRARAGRLSQAVRAGQDVAARGGGPEEVVEAAEKVLAEAGLAPDYVEVRSPTLGPAPEHGPARLLVAAVVGPTRLIDNGGLTLS